MLIRRLGARSFVLKICDKAKKDGIRWKSQTPKQVQCHHQDLLFQYFNSFWQKTDQSRLCRRVKSCTVCVRPIRRLPPLCRPIRARYSAASTNHAAALHFLQPIAALEVASKPRAKSEQNLRRLFQTHKRSLWRNLFKQKWMQKAADHDTNQWIIACVPPPNASIHSVMPCLFRELKQFLLQKLLRDGIANVCDFQWGENPQKLHFLAHFGFVQASQLPSGAWGACCLARLRAGLREKAHWEVRFQFRTKYSFMISPMTMFLKVHKWVWGWPHQQGAPESRAAHRGGATR